MVSWRRSSPAVDRRVLAMALLLAGCFDAADDSHPSSTGSESSGWTSMSWPTSGSDSLNGSQGSSGGASDTTDSTLSETDKTSSDGTTTLEPCTGNESRICGDSDVGACSFGTQVCIDDTWDLQCRGEIAPSLRNCYSSADNDCNGVADNVLDDMCLCAPGSTQACEAHPGHDGYGPCQAGTQRCETSEDKTTSFWGTCEGAVGPTADDDCDGKIDANCDGVLTCGCATDDPPVACGECEEGLRYCTADGVWGDCEGATGPKETFYLDGDGDGYGNAYQPTVSCTGMPDGYVSDSSDCCDTDGNVYPGASAQAMATHSECLIVGDFNCDGEAQYAESTDLVACNSRRAADQHARGLPTCEGGSGWVSLPVCGSEGEYAECQPINESYGEACLEIATTRFPWCQ